MNPMDGATKRERDLSNDISEVLRSIRANSKRVADEDIKAMEEDEQKKKVDDFQKKLKQSNIPKRFINATFENIEKRGIPPEIVEHYKLAKTYAHDFKANKEKGEGLIFSGSVGRMKTTIAAAVLHDVLKHGFSGYFISMPELMDTMLSMSRGDNTEFRRFQARITTCSILVLDDMGAEYSTDWVLNKVDAIITHRYNDMLPVIITTNLRRCDMQERYMQRIYDRLRSTSLLLVDGGKSLRTTAK